MGKKKKSTANSLKNSVESLRHSNYQKHALCLKIKLRDRTFNFAIIALESRVRPIYRMDCRD